MGLDLKESFPKRPRLKDFDYKGTYAYFITIRSRERSVRFKKAEVVDCLIHILNNNAERERFRILTYCFMPDHFHLLAIGEDDKSDLKRFISSFKQESGYWFKRNYGEDLWHISFYDHILRKEESLESVASYILENPVRKGIVSDYRDYPFSGFVAQPFRADSGLKP
jgi:REP element-mobilizing transposase RayT